MAPDSLNRLAPGAVAAPCVWALTGIHNGDNAQVLALAEELGLAFVHKPLTYNHWHHLTGRVVHEGLLSLTPQSRVSLKAPWPDLVIAVGRRSVPVARWIRSRSGGNTRIVQIGNPRQDPEDFDLVLTTRQYPVPPGRTVRVLPIAMSRMRTPPQRSDEERARLAALPRPHLLLALGGPTRHFTVTARDVASATERLCARAEQLGGTVIAVASQRTSSAMICAVRAAITRRGYGHFVEPGTVRFTVLMDDADEIFPTADSVSMISEALITGKPVGLIPARQTRASRLVIGASEHETGRFHDLRRFWNHLRSAGRLGTVDAPVSSDLANPVVAVAREVRALIGR